MACLLPGSGDSTASQGCIATAAGLLQDALRAKLGLPQPRLLDLIQVCTLIPDFRFQIPDFADRHHTLVMLYKLLQMPLYLTQMSYNIQQ